MKLFKNVFKVDNVKVVCELHNYTDNGNSALQLTDCSDYCPYARATINIDKLEEGYAYINDFDENKGMLNSLTKSGVVEFVEHRHTKAGVYPLVKIKLDLFNEDSMEDVIRRGEKNE